MRRLLAIALAAGASAAVADPLPDWSLCSGEWSEAPRRAAPVERAVRIDSPVQLEADHSESSGDKAELSGDVVLRRADQLLRADFLRYDRGQSAVQAEGNIEYREPGLRIFAPLAELQLDHDRGRMTDIEYRIAESHARGNAERIELAGPEVARMFGVSYTTCDPGSEAWMLRAGEIALDRESGFGDAWHTRLEIFGVPVLYVPWFSFPIDDRRKTGFLFPSFGHGDTSGAEIEIPYYINLAPNHDATLAPRWLSRRGTQVKAQYRYLYETQDGELNVEHLENDDLTDTDRSLISFRHDGRIGARGFVSAAADRVTDAQYFHDLGNQLDLASITHLERRADIGYRAPDGSILLRAQEFQTVDATVLAADRPYRRLPQVLLEYEPRRTDSPWAAQVRVEHVEFDHEQRLSGRRTDVQPSFGLPFEASWGFIEPRAGLRHTVYRLDVTPPADPQPERSVPIYSLGGGLIFEREWNNGGRQTLEPRFYYLRVPNQDQSALPVFDTARLDFSFAQLFRENRFSGADRQGDADQLSLALSTHLYSAEGTERLAANIGQILYFRDREVVLPGGPVETAPHSFVASDLSSRLANGLSLRISNLWDPDRDESAQTAARLRFQVDPRRILDFGYRNERGVVEQTDLAIRWPFGPRWRGFARWNYALDVGRSLDTLAGLEYESCCWSARFASRNYVANNDALGEINHTYYIEIELKGLSRAGGKIDALLETGILGATP